MNSDTPIVVGAFVTVITLFIGVTKVMLNQATEDRDSDRAERLRLADAITEMAKNSGRQATVTKQGFENLVESTDKQSAEAKERNGHLAELVIQQGHQTEALAKGAVESISKVVGKVKEQHVEHQHIEESIVENKK